MEFIYGALGMIAVLLIFASGVLAGWKVKDKFNSVKAKVEEDVLTEQERIARKQEDQAFSSLIGYNVDVAYGVYSSPLDTKDGGI